MAVEAIDLDLRRGDFVTLVGPSGCGKSTVLRIVAGLEKQTSGRVMRPDAPPGCVFQQANLLAWRNARSATSSSTPSSTACPRKRRRELTRDALELVGLTGFEKHLPHQLSGGMQMRAALARALVTRPELLLFDEPFSAVDELLRERLQEELIRLFTAEQFAGLFITHAVSEAVFLSTRVLVMTPAPWHASRPRSTCRSPTRARPSSASRPSSSRSCGRSPASCAAPWRTPDGHAPGRPTPVDLPHDPSDATLAQLEEPHEPGTS